MEDYNGIAISKNDKEFVVAFDNFVNGKMQSATNTGNRHNTPLFAVAGFQSVRCLYPSARCQLPNRLL